MSRRGRRGGDWVPCLGYGSVGFITAATPADVLLVAARQNLTPGGGEIALREDDDDLIVHRVVGSMELSLATEDPDGLAERIRMGLFDDAGLIAFFADSFEDASQANEPFLWQRNTQYTVTGQSNQDFLAHPYWSLIDIRVKRRIRRDEGLFWSGQITSATAQIRFVPRLRSWVTPA